MKEDKVQSRLREALERAGCFVVKLHGSEYQAGVPDLLVIRHRVYLVEVKAEGTRFQPAQLGFLKRCTMCECQDVMVFRGTVEGWDTGNGLRPWSELDNWVTTRFE